MRSQARLSRRTLAASALLAAPAVTSVSGYVQSTPAATPSGGTRTITDVIGEVEVPANPTRVVVLDGPQLDACLAVGVKPVGAVTGFEGAAFPAYLGDMTEGIENVGTISEPNLEKIIALEPDLILGSNLRNEEIHHLLVEIAPTVFSEAVSDDWRGNFELFTNALGKSAEAEEISAAFDTRLEEFRAATESERSEWVISVVRFLADNVRLYNTTSFIGTILTAAELSLPETQQGPDPETGSIFTQISLEQIHLADGTHIFTCAYGDPKDTQAVEYANSTLWQSLQAVQDNQVYWVDDDFWMVAIGYLAANRVVDDLFTYLVDGAPGSDIPV
jgi:iron complex transport system substrate-binding protein